MIGVMSLRVLLASAVILVLIENGLIAAKCPQIQVKKDTIIRTKESIRNGARMLYRTEVRSSRQCYELCCKRKACNIGVVHYKKLKDELTGNILTSKSCFIFDCGTANQCLFMNHTGYAVIEMKREQPKIKPTEKKLQPVNEEDCPPGAPVAMCSGDPCDLASCPAHPSARCVPNFCGGCNAVFYDRKGKKVLCAVKHAKIRTTPAAIDTEPEPTNDNNEPEETNVNEEEIEIKPEDTGGKPTEDPDYADHKEKDPHAVKEWRTWLDSKEDFVTSTTARPVVVTTQAKQVNNTSPSSLSDADKPGTITEILIEKKVSWLPFNLPLAIASSVCILILFAVIIRLKCMGPKKKKKFAVDDGDYLINGMYL